MNFNLSHFSSDKYAYLNKVNKMSKWSRLHYKILKPFLCALMLFYASIVYGATFPPYADVAVYIQKPILRLEDPELDFTPIHQDMARLEYGIKTFCMNKKEEDKNIFIVRFTPVFEDTVKVEVNNSIKIIYTPNEGRDNWEYVFVSGALPLTPAEQSEVPKPPQSASAAFKLMQGPMPSMPIISSLLSPYVMCEGYAGSIKNLQDTLLRRFPEVGGSSSGRPEIDTWIEALKLGHRVGEVKREVDSFAEAFGRERDISLPKVAAHTRVMLELVKPQQEKGSFCCSEQNAYRYIMEDEVFNHIIAGLKAQTSPARPLKALVINGHTTKHPCRVCGLTFYAEADARIDSFTRRIGELIEYKIEDFKVATLISYRDPHLTLPIKIPRPDILPHIDIGALSPRFGLIELLAPTISLQYKFKEDVPADAGAGGAGTAGSSAGTGV